MVCHVLLLRLHVPQVTRDLCLLVESVVFPTNPPPPPWSLRVRCDLGDWRLGGAEPGFPSTQEALLV